MQYLDANNKRVSVSAATPMPVVAPAAPTGTSAQQVQGTVADGATDAGNPVTSGLVYSGLAGRTAALTAGQRGVVQGTPNGAVLVGGLGFTGSDAVGNTPSVSSIRSIMTTSGNGGGPLATAGWYFNGTSWDRQRGDTGGIWTSGTVFWTDSAVALAASATFTGSSRDSGGIAAGVGTRFNMFVAKAYANQTGTLYIDSSVDASTWYQEASVAVVAGTASSLKIPITTRYHRARFVNGATANTAFQLTSGYTSA